MIVTFINKGLQYNTGNMEYKNKNIDSRSSDEFQTFAIEQFEKACGGCYEPVETNTGYKVFDENR